ncbi:MAG: type II toxin-antitoxin system VapB family antitoxin [Propioniciclava sp.]
MKTTIELPDALAAEARALAHAEHTSLRELMIGALRAEIDRRSAAPAADFIFPTATGKGLTVGLAPGDAIERSYGFSA